VTGRETGGWSGTIASVFDDASAQRLRSAPLAWLTTVRADGQPQTSYVWFHHDGEDIVLLSQPKALKIRNIKGNPRVSLNLDGDTATGGGVLTLEGAARSIGEMPADRWLAYLAKYEGRIRKGPWGNPDGFISVFSSAIRIVPTRVRAW
jgi:PPOX class probable F420-dependent enzyme